MRPASLVAFVLCALLVATAAAQDAGVAAPPATTTHSVSRATHSKAVTTHRTTTHRRAAARPPDLGDGTSLSIGRHNRGRLLRAHEMHETPALYLKSPQSDARFGTDELVGMLERAAARVMARSPGSQLMVGNLSHRSGGRFRPHRSHQSGRDVDLGFYVVDASGAPLRLDRFYDFRRDLTVRGRDDIHFDVARNWQLVEAMITDEVPVQWIFVCRYIRTALLEEGARQGASLEVLTHADAILSQPSHGGTHNDQFHVRIYCPANDRPRCLDDPPLHPWMVSETVEIQPRDPNE